MLLPAALIGAVGVLALGWWTAGRQLEPESELDAPAPARAQGSQEVGGQVGPAPLAEGSDASERVESELAESTGDARAWAIWRDLGKLERKPGKRAREQRRRTKKARELTLELGRLARAGSGSAVELLARLTAEPAASARRLGLRLARLGPALSGIEDPRIPRAIRRGYEQAPDVAQRGAFLSLAAQHGGDDGARLLLEAYDAGEPELLEVLFAALPTCKAGRGLQSAWLERVQQASPELAPALVSALVARDDPELQHALRALVHAVHLELDLRGALATTLARQASPEVALELALPFWTTRGAPQNAVHVAAARAALENEAIPAAELLRVVEPIAAELVLDSELDARRAGLELLAAPALASQRSLDLLALQRPELNRAGLAREARRTIRALAANLRALRRARSAAQRPATPR